MQKHVQTRKRSLLGFLLMLCAFATMAQSQTVKGKVTDSETGEPLPGVNVLVKGTSTGSTTDADGVYSVAASSKDVLVFSFIGFTTIEVTVGEQTTIDLKLIADAQALGEVVVVGYGTQKKEHLTGAVATTNIEQYAKIPTGNALTALQGQIAGVSVSTGTGNPANGPSVNIRGLGSVNGVEPLYVIDGIPANPSYLNPAEIESISILKDASAATIYGSRGFGGVVMITTKRGKQGVPRLTFDSFVGVNQVNLNGVNPATREERNKIATESFTNAGQPVPAFANPANQSSFANTDWADKYFKSGLEQKYDVGISGGSDKMAYNLLLGYYNHSGTIINTGVERYNSRLNLDFKDLIKNRLNVTSTVAFNRKNVKNYYDDIGGGSSFSGIMSLFQTLPHKRVYDKDAPYGYAGHVPALGTAGGGNIVGERMLNRDRDQTDYLQANIGAELRLIDGLTYKFSLGFSSEDYYNDSFSPGYDFGPGAIIETPRIWQFRSRFNYAVINNVLNYSKSFDKHNLAILLGQSSEEGQYKSVGGSNLELPSPVIEGLSSGIGLRNSYGSVSSNRLHSYFGRLTYNYDQRYFVEGSFRRDGSSRFGPENRYANFYSFSAGWAIHRENFFSSDFITELKPRFSYGVVGNQNIGDFRYQAIIETGGTTLNYAFGTGGSPLALVGATSIALADASIKWEQNQSINFGLDVTLFGGKVSATLDYFNNKAKDMLAVDPLAPSSGIQVSPIRNVGTMENKGFEVNLKYRGQSGELKYNIGLNFFGTENKVLDFKDNQIVSGFVEFNNYSTTRTEAGRPIGSFYLYDAVGIFQTQAEIDAYVGEGGAKIQPLAAPGDLKFRDINDDGEINDEDRKYFGVGIPKMELGFNADVTWKNFDAVVMFAGTFGNKMYNAFKHNTYRLGFNADLADSWSATNKNSDIPRLINSDPNGNYKVASDFFLENGSYLRLRNLQVGYNVPSSLIEKIGLTKMRIYVAGYNLLTFTKYSGFDPGATNYGIYARGVDRGYYPISKSFVGGLSLTF